MVHGREWSKKGWWNVLRYFQIPYITKYEDKLLGGKLTLRQGAYYLGVILIAFWAFGNYQGYMYPRFNVGVFLFRVFLVVVSLIIATLFAFIKVREVYYLDKYLLKAIVYSLRKKITVYKRDY